MDGWMITVIFITVSLIVMLTFRVSYDKANKRAMPRNETNQKMKDKNDHDNNN
jgi:hypothetical protein